jgi:hypothetical protein
LFSGGCVPLHRLQLQFSAKVIQTLLDKELVQVQNTGTRLFVGDCREFLGCCDLKKILDMLSNFTFQKQMSNFTFQKREKDNSQKN